MPKKKKNFGVSPSRKNTNPETMSAPDASSSPASLHGINKEELISGLSEMFSDLDPTVIYMVLSECDFKVEDTMDDLLELSTAAKDTICSSNVSGFDSLSALLVGGNNSSCSTHELEGNDTTAAVAKCGEESQQPWLSEELARLIDNALEKCGQTSEAKESGNDRPLGSLTLAQDHSNSNCTELCIKSSGTAIENWLTASKPSYSEASESMSITEVETKDILTQNPESCSLPEVVLDSGAVSDIVTLADKAESYADPNQMQKVLFDFIAVSTPTAQQCHGFAKIETNASPNSSASSSSRDAEEHENGVALCNDLKKKSVPDLCTGSGLKSAPFTRETDPSQQTWSSPFSLFQTYPQQLSFYPAFDSQGGNHSFVTPIALSPGKWRPALDGKSQGRTFCSPGVSKSWEMPKRCGSKNGRQRHHFSHVHPLPGGHATNTKAFPGPVLVLLRGLPGSGKSYLARVLLEDNPGGIMLSTDDYFYQKNGQYQFDADCLADAHEWNWKRAKEAFEKRITPIIIDNTNTQAWEMKPYIALSQQHKYKVIFREPDTWWKFKPKELERRNVHGVSKEKIKRMLERYEHCLTVNSILNSSISDGMKKIATCAEVPPREKRQGKEEQKETFASSLQGVELNPGEKAALEEVTAEDRHLQNEKRRAGPDSQESSSERSIDCVDADALPAEIEMESILETELRPVLDSSDNTLLCNKSELKLQIEATTCHEITEAELTETQNKGGDLNSGNSVKPETFSFVGDWPVEQTLRQRVKRNKRLDKHARRDKGDLSVPTSTLDSLKNTSEDKKSDFVDGPQELPLSEEKCKDKCEENNCNFPSTSMPEVNTEVHTTELLMVGDWPVQTLQQRRHRMQRITKRDVSESEELGNSQHEVNADDGDATSLLNETSADVEEQWAPSKEEHFQGSEIAALEALSEKKAAPNKRTRKHHKLALTFTNNSALNKPGEAPSLCNWTEEKPNECVVSEATKYSQTEPRDFALLWRLEREIVFSEDTKVLHGRLDGFVPKRVEAIPDCPEKIPYKATYERSTYVEESELVSVDESENLNILCKLFGSLSFDAIKDLYERCNRDMDWATGLLLDSAEKLCKEDDVEGLQKVEVPLPDMSLPSFLTHPSEVAEVPLGDNGENISDPLAGKSVNSSSGENKIHPLPATGEHADSSDPEGDPLNGQTKQRISWTRSENKPRSSSSICETDIDVRDEVGGPWEATRDVEDAQPPADRQEGPFPEDTSDLERKEATDSSRAESDRFEQGRKTEGGPSVVVATQREKNDSERDPGTVKLQNSMSHSKSVTDSERDPGTVRLQNSMSHSKSVSIDCLELVLAPELAMQLSEIFGPVGVDTGSLTPDDYVVHIDLNLAREIHDKWKASIMKRQRREEELCKLFEENPVLFEQLHPGQVDGLLSQYAADFQGREQERLPMAASAESSAACEVFPYMDHWNVHTQKVSLREIMSEEIALQERLTLKPFPCIAKKDCAAKLKEKQLLELFPTISANFLMDIFKDYNYSLEQTVQFLNSVLEADPIKNVVAKEPAQNPARSPSNASKSREKKAMKTKELEDILSEKGFQDTQYPGYEDFRAEAFLHQQQRQECLRKAGEAYRMGMKPVAAFYVQQGQLHEQKMKEANQDAAQQIFEKVNASKLPINLLDLHGLHVDEALGHLSRVLQEKTTECSLAGGVPYLYVITGRGNHSQGGVARIKPAVMKYLTSHKFRFTEIKSGSFKIWLE